MMPIYTTAQIAVMIDRSERQVQRLIRSGTLPASLLRGNRYDVNEDDLQQFLPHGVVEGLSERLSALEQRIEALEAMLSAAAPTRPSRSPPVARETSTSYFAAGDSLRSATPTSGKVPEGAVLMYVFAKAHGMSVETVRHHIRIGEVHTFDLDSQSRPGQKDRYFTQDQQRDAVQKWRRNPKFTECEDCPH